MLYRFRYPRTRPWDKYLKNLVKFLEKNDKTAHIVAYLNACQEHRSKLVKLLDECTRDVRVDPQAFIKILDDYIPALEDFAQALVNNHVNLYGKLEIVWTSSLASNLNVKSQSAEIQWERVMAYIILGICEYQIAVETHHTNRAQAADVAREQKEQKQVDEQYDKIFGEVKPIEDAQIFDDPDLIKKISLHLKKASSIWQYVSTLYPVNAFNPVQKNGANIPETFRDLLSAMANIAAANAQEFMVQLAVQTKKSYVLTAKLAQGVGETLILSDKRLRGNLGQINYGNIKLDLRLYLRLRGMLYEAIACKYHAKSIQKVGKDESDTDKLTEALHYYNKGLKILTMGFRNNSGQIRHAAALPQALDAVKILSKIVKQNPFEKPALNTVRIIAQSVKKQAQSIKELYDEQADENKNVYICFVQASDNDLLTLTKIESKMVIKPAKFEGIPGTDSHKLVNNNNNDDNDNNNNEEVKQDNNNGNDNNGNDNNGNDNNGNDINYNNGND